MSRAAKRGTMSCGNSAFVQASSAIGATSVRPNSRTRVSTFCSSSVSASA
jgi:hypothetical protein